MNVSQGSPVGYQPLTVIPGLGSIAARTFADYDIRNLVDLARLDPYDQRFTKLGDGFPRWVLYSRTALADEIIRDVEVTPGEIRVTAQRTYDPDVSTKSVMGRLGVYYVYVEVALYEGPSGYTISITPKPEYIGSVQWNEYRMNASLLAARGFQKEQVRPPPSVRARSRWRNFRDFEVELLEAVQPRKDIHLLFKVFTKLLLCDRVNLLVVWSENSANRTTVRHMLSRISPRLVHVMLGGNKPEMLKETISHSAKGSLLVLDDVEKAEPHEKKALLDILAVRRFQPWPGEPPVHVDSNIIVNAWLKEGSQLLDPDILGLVSVALRMPKSQAAASWVSFIDNISDEDSEALQQLVLEILNRPSPTPTPEVTPRPITASFRPPDYLTGLGPSLGLGFESFAAAVARSRYKDKVEQEDYREANALIQECLRSLPSR